MPVNDYYGEIITALSGDLDADLFERSVPALLKEVGFSVVPVRGGSDAGMDGGVFDGEAEEFPLVCTTAKDVLGNLTRSLKAYRSNGGERIKVMLATSTELNRRKRQSLEKRARDLGFVLVKLFAQEALAQILYDRPDWTQRLLGLTGEPLALSPIPRTRRPLQFDDLVGRDKELEWISDRGSDALIVGVPGSGKTALMHRFGMDNQGFFVVEWSRAKVPVAIRRLKPRWVLVDDAHLNLEFLSALCQLREEMETPFLILASCWPGRQHQVEERLGVPKHRTLELSLLTRDEIVKIANLRGISGPDELIREIVDQAEGRPGLAVTLCHMCLQGSGLDVALGDVLAKSVRTSFEELVGPEVMHLLGVLSLAGDEGVDVDGAVGILGIPCATAMTMINDLAAGGVVTEVAASSSLSVRPPALREVLVRDLFFRGAFKLPLARCLDILPQKCNATSSILGAYSRGADVPKGLIRELLREADSSSLWNEYARHGENETRYVLEVHPKHLGSIASVALHYLPNETIPRLLDSAITPRASGTGWRGAEDPLRKIEGWVSEQYPGEGKAVPVRLCLVREVRAWMKTRGDSRIAAKALSIAISPGFERVRSDPGSGRTLHFSKGLITIEEIEELRDVWQQGLEILPKFAASDFNSILHAVRGLCFPNSFMPKGVPEEIVQTCRDVASTIIGDLVQATTGHNGVQQRLAELEKAVGLPKRTSVDPAFGIIHDRPRGWDEVSLSRRKSDLTRLAERWALDDPTDVVSRMRVFYEQALQADLTEAPLSSFCRELAAVTTPASNWLRLLESIGLPPGFTCPFLWKVVDEKESGWEMTIEEAFDGPLSDTAIWIVLTLEKPPDGLFDRALKLLSKGNRGVPLWNFSALPTRTLSGLLKHRSDKVAFSTAIGLWYRNSCAPITAEIMPLWRKAILRSSEGHDTLPEILGSDSELAVAWLKRGRRNQRFVDYDRAVEASFSAIPEDERIEVLCLIDDESIYPDTIEAAVCGNLGAFGELLKNHRFSRKQLDALITFGAESIGDAVVMAMESGHTSDDIVAALVCGGGVWSGKSSDRWESQIARLKPLLSHPDLRVQNVGREGTNYSVRARNDATDRERKRDVYGRDW